MLVKAGYLESYKLQNEELIAKRIRYLLHLNSKILLKFYLRYLENAQVNNEEEKLMLNMLYYTFYKYKLPNLMGFESIEEGIEQILINLQIKDEIKQIQEYNYENIELAEKQHDFPFVTPLRIHAKYTSDQIMAALGYYNEENSPTFRVGVKFFKDKRLDAFFITLNKSEKDFSPFTLYEDYAINERLFHGQSQSKTSIKLETAQRYIHHKKRKNQIALFVREYRAENGLASPYVFLGTANYVSHSGDKPIWKLKEEIPAYLVESANKIFCK